jgi:DHA1 family inner membrane transport protein
VSSGGVLDNGSSSTASLSGSDHPFKWKAALILFGILFVGVSDTQLIPPLLPLIAKDLGTTPGRAGTMVTMYALAAAAFALLAGTASDRFGRKRLIVLALGVFSAAAVLTFQASHFSTLLLTRMLTGLSAGALSTLGLSYAADLYPYRHRGKAMGIISMAYFLAFVIGIPLGSIIAARFGWRWVFMAVSGAGVVMLFLALFFLPDDRKRAAPGSRTSFLTHFRVSERVAGIVAAFLTSGGMVGFLTYVGAWLNADQGIGIDRIYPLFMAAGLAATVASPISGWLSDHIGKKKVVVWANLGLSAMFLVVSGMEWGIALFAGIGLLSITASARQAPLHALTTELVSSDVRGSYVAARNAASQLGIAAAAAISAFAFDTVGFAGVAWIAAGTTILVPVICRWIGEPVSPKASVEPAD